MRRVAPMLERPSAVSKVQPKLRRQQIRQAREFREEFQAFQPQRLDRRHCIRLKSVSMSRSLTLNSRRPPFSGGTLSPRNVWVWMQTSGNVADHSRFNVSDIHRTIVSRRTTTITEWAEGTRFCNRAAPPTSVHRFVRHFFCCSQSPTRLPRRSLVSTVYSVKCRKAINYVGHPHSFLSAQL